MKKEACVSTLAQEREAAITMLFGFAKKTLAREGVTDASLQSIENELAQLAAQKHFFSIEEFPASTTEGGIALYQLRVLEDNSLALYLNVLQPDKQSKPHNHKTWATIAAVEGEELNRIYRRRDDGSDPTRADLEVAREITVQPGNSTHFMPEDIHSIHGKGTDTIRHLHMYGCPLDKLSGREGFDLETGAVVNYNNNYMTPAIIPTARGVGAVE